MPWDIGFDDEFAAELEAQSDAVNDEVNALSGLLREFGPQRLAVRCAPRKVGSKQGRSKMTVSLDERLQKLPPDRRARIQARTRELIEDELTLRDLRQAGHLTQERMAELMGVEQASISRLERRADLLLSTLGSYVAAMGGRLRLVAEFPDRRPVAIALADVAGHQPPKRTPRKPSRAKT